MRGIRVVKAYVREEYETEKFQNVSGRLYKAFSKAQKDYGGRFTAHAVLHLLGHVLSSPSFYTIITSMVWTSTSVSSRHCSPTAS